MKFSSPQRWQYVHTAEVPYTLGIHGFGSSGQTLDILAEVERACVPDLNRHLRSKALGSTWQIISANFTAVHTPSASIDAIIAKQITQAAQQGSCPVTSSEGTAAQVFLWTISE